MGIQPRTVPSIPGRILDFLPSSLVQVLHAETPVLVWRKQDTSLAVQKSGMPLMFQYVALLHRLFAYHVIELLYPPLSEAEREDQLRCAVMHWNVCSLPSPPWHDEGPYLSTLRSAMPRSLVKHISGQQNITCLKICSSWELAT